jgi:hypothetical protein
MARPRRFAFLSASPLRCASDCLVISLPDAQFPRHDIVTQVQMSSRSPPSHGADETPRVRLATGQPGQATNSSNEGTSSEERRRLDVRPHRSTATLKGGSYYTNTPTHKTILIPLSRGTAHPQWRHQLLKPCHGSCNVHTTPRLTSDGNAHAKSLADPR